MKSYVVLFLAGFANLMLELAAVRVVAPFYGMSIFVWTNVIGVFMAFSGLGLWVGGLWGENKLSFVRVSWLLLLIGCLLILIPWLEEPLLFYLKPKIPDVKTGSLLATIFLFGVPIFLLGVIFPLIGQLKLVTLSQSGQQSGLLFLALTLGSLCGVFVTGFGSFKYIGHQGLIIAISLIMIIMAIQVNPEPRWKLISPLLIISLICLWGLSFKQKPYKKIDQNSAYNRIWIYDIFTRGLKRTARRMQINNENSSEVFMDSKEPVTSYSLNYEYFTRHFVPQHQKTLMLGGGGYAYPKYFLSQFPALSIDVVEIDPIVTDLAYQYFKIPQTSRLQPIHQDARLFLKRSLNRYDVIINEAYHSNQPIYQLLTQEAFQEVKARLNPKGILMVFMMSAIEGDDGKALRATFHTMKTVFHSVELFSLFKRNRAQQIQPQLLIAFNSERQSDFSQANKYMNKQWKQPISTDMPILKDDYVPIDYMGYKKTFRGQGLA